MLKQFLDVSKIGAGLVAEQRDSKVHRSKMCHYRIKLEEGILGILDCLGCESRLSTRGVSLSLS